MFPGIAITTIAKVSIQFNGLRRKFKNGLLLFLYVIGETNNSIERFTTKRANVTCFIFASIIQLVHDAPFVNAGNVEIITIIVIVNSSNQGISLPLRGIVFFSKNIKTLHLLSLLIILLFDFI
jgi:hypothetical protein